jgi:hypothetical protein
MEKPIADITGSLVHCMKEMRRNKVEGKKEKW